jgi:hypothetical protein
MTDLGGLYGMTPQGGGGDGTIFSINTDGTGFHSVFSFNGTDGELPHGDLTLNGSTMYGMTKNGGSSGNSGLGNGVVFALTIPEPSGLALLAAGAIGLLAYGWRRRR